MSDEYQTAGLDVSLASLAACFCNLRSSCFDLIRLCRTSSPKACFTHRQKRRKYLHRPVSNVFSRKLTKDFHLSPDVSNETLLHQHTAATNNLAKCGEGLPFWLVRTACLLLTYYECKHSRASEASGGMRCAWLMH